MSSKPQGMSWFDFYTQQSEIDIARMVKDILKRKRSENDTATSEEENSHGSQSGPRIMKTPTSKKRPKILKPELSKCPEESDFRVECAKAYGADYVYYRDTLPETIRALERDIRLARKSIDKDSLSLQLEELKKTHRSNLRKQKFSTHPDKVTGSTSHALSSYSHCPDFYNSCFHAVAYDL